MVGRWHIIHPSNWQEKYHLYTTYILPFGGLYATYHLLGEPETTIEEGGRFVSRQRGESQSFPWISFRGMKGGWMARKKGLGKFEVDVFVTSLRILTPQKWLF